MCVFVCRKGVRTGEHVFAPPSRATLHGRGARPVPRRAHPHRGNGSIQSQVCGKSTHQMWLVIRRVHATPQKLLVDSVAVVAGCRRRRRCRRVTRRTTTCTVFKLRDPAPRARRAGSGDGRCTTIAVRATRGCRLQHYSNLKADISRTGVQVSKQSTPTGAPRHTRRSSPWHRAPPAPHPAA